VLQRATREGLAQLAASGSTLPAALLREVRAALRCGVLRHGFTRVRCQACGEELLVGFSCKGRGYCASCNGKKAALTALHLVDDVLPEAPYRQWTLSLPFRLRWLALKHPPLLDFVLKALLQRVWCLQRRLARRLGVPGRLHPGAVSFTQYFGSTLQLTPHLHVLCPDGLFTEVDDGAVRFVALPPPSPADVARIASSLARRVARQLDIWGLFHADASPDGDVEQLRAQALQQSLPFAASAQSLAAVQPRKHHRRLAVVDGFSLHADTFVAQADRHGLERLCRYSARGPLAEERLSRLDDGRYAYRLRRPSHSGATSLVFTAAQLVKRLATLLPPPRRHLIRFHGVFGPNARLRPVVVRLARPRQAPASSPPPRAELPFPEQPAPRPPPRPRIDWATLLRHTFDLDVLQCPCGGRRRLLAAVVSPSVAERVLRQLGRLPPRPQLATGPPPPQLALPL
jgi:hypothetical protein